MTPLAVTPRHGSTTACGSTKSACSGTTLRCCGPRRSRPPELPRPVASILYVVHRFWPYQGGSERYFFEIARRTAADGHRVTVATTDAWDAGHLHFRRKKRIEKLTDDVDGVHIRRFRVRHFFYQQRILPRLSRLIPSRYPV